MNIFKLTGAITLATLLLAGCGGGGGSSSGGVVTGGTTTSALDPGKKGLAIAQVQDGSGALITANFVAAIDINDDLTVVGYAEVTPGSPFVASRWTVDASGTPSLAPAALDPLVNGGFAAAFALDEAGNSVGQADDGTRLVAVVWDTTGVPTVLPPLAASGNYAAYGSSADGSLIVGVAVNNTGRSRAVLWSADNNGDFLAIPLELPVNIFAAGTVLSPYSLANSVARIDAVEILVVGEAQDGNGSQHAALWRSTNGGSIFSPVDLGAGYVAHAVNGARQIAGESDLLQMPTTWSVNDQGIVSAPVSLAATGSATTINENGRIAGWSGAPADLATIWDGGTPTTMFNTASQAYGLNNDLHPMVVGRNGDVGFVKRAN